MRTRSGCSVLAVALGLGLGASFAASPAIAANDYQQPAAPPPVTGPQPEAPPPVTGNATVTVQPVRPVAERARSLFFGLQLGPAISFGCGGSSTCGSSFGVWGNALVGLSFYNGLSLALAVGARANFGSSTTSYVNVTLGARARYSLMRRRRFHPFLQVQGDAHYGSSNDILVGVGPGIGFEIDFSRRFSCELGVKTEVIFPVSSTSSSFGVEFAVLPFIGFNYYR